LEKILERFGDAMALAELPERARYANVPKSLGRHALCERELEVRRRVQYVGCAASSGATGGIGATASSERTPTSRRAPTRDFSCLRRRVRSVSATPDCARAQRTLTSSHTRMSFISFCEVRVVIVVMVLILERAAPRAQVCAGYFFASSFEGSHPRAPV